MNRSSAEGARSEAPQACAEKGGCGQDWLYATDCYLALPRKNCILLAEKVTFGAYFCHSFAHFCSV